MPRQQKRNKPPQVKEPPSCGAAAWLREHRGQMILCPSQPGNLRILPQACAKRFAIANQPRWASLNGESLNTFIIKVNLIPCRSCPIGSRHADRLGSKVA